MRLLLIVAIFGIAVVSLTSSLSGMYDGTVIKKAVAAEEEELEVIDDNFLAEYDLTEPVHDTPPPYSGKGKTNPFVVIESEKPKILKVKRVEKVKIVVPSTPLTRWVITHLNLTGVVITSESTLAFFTGPDSGKAYTGRPGDYIGRVGIKIDNITTGVVHLSNGRRLVVNQ